jgi:hypothetical protein
MLIGAAEFEENLLTERAVWIQGAKGKGKTALAYRLAIHLVEMKKLRFITSNVEDAVSNNVDQIYFGEDGLSTAVIVDEAGKFIDRNRIAKEYNADLRKLNIVLLLPSTIDPALVLRRLSCWVWVDLGYLGLPAKIIKWRYKVVDSEIKGYFLWLDYREIYGVYNTLQIVADDKGISAWIGSEASRLGGYKTSISSDHRAPGYDQGSSVAETVRDFEDSTELLESIIEESRQILSSKRRKK